MALIQVMCFELRAKQRTGMRPSKLLRVKLRGKPETTETVLMDATNIG